MYFRSAVVFTVALALLACSDEAPETLSFTPENGEHRRYQMFNETYIEATRAAAKDSEKIVSHIIMDYDVTEKMSDYAVLMRPQYLITRFRNSSISNLVPPNFRQQQLWPMLEAGVTTVIDKKNGKLKKVIVHQQIDDADDTRFDPVQNLLQDKLSQPGFGNGIELRPGAVQKLATTAELPEITLTVDALTEQHVGLTVQAENAEVRLYGNVMLERTSGWLVRSAIVIEMPLQDPYAEGKVRIVSSVMPAEWKFGQDLEFMDDDHYQLPVDTSTLPDSQHTLAMAPEAQVFPGSNGSIELFGDNLTLQYTHDVYNHEPLGHFEISNLQARDSAGSLIDLHLHNESTFSYRLSETSAMNTSTRIYPLGWRDTAAKLEQIAYIEATVKRFPISYNIVTMPLKDTETIIEHDAARAILTPTKQSGVYQLKLEPSERAYFSPTVEGPSSGSVKHENFTTGPAWLSYGENQLMQVVKNGYFPTIYTLYFEGERPKQIRLLANRIEDQVLQEKQIRFYNPEAAFNDLRIAPLKSEYLFPQQDDFNIDDLGDLQFKSVDLQHIAPQHFNRPQLYMVLSQEQAALCQLEQTADIDEAGRKLSWQPRDPRQQYIQRELRLPREVVFQLTTTDGIRDTFYQHEATVQLQCAGQPQWQPLDIDLGEQSWLISAADLLGKNWQDEFADMSVLALLRRFRFEDSQQKALSVLPPPDYDRQQRLVLADIKLADFVTADNQLRIAGRVMQVKKLHATGKPVVQQWQHTFPALPSAKPAYPN